jgi:hypothetical protein
MARIKVLPYTQGTFEQIAAAIDVDVAQVAR